MPTGPASGQRPRPATGPTQTPTPFPAVMIKSVPPPAPRRWVGYATSPLVALCAQPPPRRKVIRTPALHLALCGRQGRQQCMLPLGPRRGLGWSALRTGRGLTGSPRAVSRMPLPLSAISTLWAFTGGDGPAEAESSRQGRPWPGGSRQRSRCVPAGLWPGRTLSPPSQEGQGSTRVSLIPSSKVAV